MRFGFVTSNIQDHRPHNILITIVMHLFNRHTINIISLSNIETFILYKQNLRDTYGLYNLLTITIVSEVMDNYRYYRNYIACVCVRVIWETHKLFRNRATNVSSASDQIRESARVADAFKCTARTFSLYP